MLAKLKLTISDFILPGICVLCGLRVHKPLLACHPRDLCYPCLQDLPIVTQKCIRCAIPLIQRGAKICGICLKTAPYFDRTFSPYLYQYPMRHLIFGLKYAKRLVFGRVLGELLLQHLVEQNITLPDVILPVPLHAKRLKQRGFNQALEIARPIARYFRLPVLKNLLIRQRDTPSQTLFQAEKRKLNLRDAFNLQGSLSAAHVALIDDVMTTGSTVGEISKLLHTAGAKEISVWCCARA